MKQVARLLGAAATMWSICAVAIEAPKPAPSSPPPEPAQTAVVPTDEQSFYQQLQRVTHRRNLRELNPSNEVIQALARGDADNAVASLTTLAASGDASATIALVRIQNWCGRMSAARPADVQTQIQKLSTELGPTRSARAAGVLQAEVAYIQRVRDSCARAAFDYGGIESQLRQSASAGQAASATELAQFTRDPAKRDALLQAAIAKNYAPALYALATARLMAVQRGETTENVGSIRELLKQAGRSLPRAKLDLANCMSLGCDGHPADAATASAFGMDAARDGEPASFLSMVRMPWGGRFTRNQLLAWQYFGDRLNESGCMGEGYVMNSLGFAQSIAALEKGQGEKFIAQAKGEADILWRDNAARALKEQGCE